MTTEFKSSIYKSSLNEDEKNYLANIADQYTADGRSMPCDHDERLAKLKIQKRVSKMRVLRTMNTDLILSICESALSDPEKEYLIAVAEGTIAGKGMANTSKKIVGAGAFTPVRK